jgi:hypothetical protein
MRLKGCLRTRGSATRKIRSIGLRCTWKMSTISPQPRHLFYDDFELNSSFIWLRSRRYSLLRMHVVRMLLFRYDLKLSFCQVHNFAIALIINFSF